MKHTPTKTMRSLTPVEPAAVSSRRLGFIAALYTRDFRHLWVAYVCSAFVQRMDGVLLGWLVLELTHSAFLVGLVIAVRRVGSLFGPWAGVVADRMDRRRLALMALTLMTLVVSTLAMLVFIRRLEVWHLFIASISSGIVWAFFQPAQQSMPADILQSGDLANGIALTNLAMNLTTIGGPVLTGLLLTCCRPARRVWDWSDSEMVLSLNWPIYDAQRLYAATSQGRVLMSHDHGANWGPAPFGLPGMLASALQLEDAVTGVQWAYVVMVALHFVQLVCYFMMQPLAPRHRRDTVSIWQNLQEGLRYSRQEAGVWTSLVLAGLINFATFPIQSNLLPVFARDVFSVGAAGLGWLGAAVGAGALLGSFLMIRMGSMHRAGPMMAWGTFLWSLFVAIFAFMPSYPIALVVLVLSGMAQAICLTNMSIMLLNTSTNEMRGRVMGLRSLAIAPLFLGGMLSGAAAEHFGAPLTTLACGVVGIAVTLAVAPWIPKRGGR
jgi:MFS family permease